MNSAVKLRNGDEWAAAGQAVVHVSQENKTEKNGTEKLMTEKYGARGPESANISVINFSVLIRPSFMGSRLVALVPLCG
jgi:hypothetical protein